MNAEKITFLKQIELFAKFNESSLETIAEVMLLKTYKNGDKIIKQGTTFLYICVVIDLHWSLWMNLFSVLITYFLSFCKFTLQLSWRIFANVMN